MLQKLREFFRNKKRLALVLAVVGAALVYAGLPAPMVDAILATLTNAVSEPAPEAPTLPPFYQSQPERR